MPDLIQSRWLPIVLLTCSNVFMTLAWYGHLKFKSKPLLLVILVSWGIAFFEYVLQVPANRWGSSVYSPFQLKIIQEIITLIVFTGAAVMGQGLQTALAQIAADQLGVSRSSVREAIRVLEHAGVLDVRTGSGTYVTREALSQAAASAPAAWWPSIAPNASTTRRICGAL